MILLLIQALFGKLFFGEMLSLQWWFGASLIILGLYIINKNKSDEDISESTTSKKETWQVLDISGTCWDLLLSIKILQGREGGFDREMCGRPLINIKLFSERLNFEAFVFDHIVKSQPQTVSMWFPLVGMSQKWNFFKCIFMVYFYSFCQSNLFQSFSEGLKQHYDFDHVVKNQPQWPCAPPPIVASVKIAPR